MILLLCVESTAPFERWQHPCSDGYLEVGDIYLFLPASVDCLGFKTDYPRPSGFQERHRPFHHAGLPWRSRILGHLLYQAFLLHPPRQMTAACATRPAPPPVGVPVPVHWMPALVKAQSDLYRYDSIQGLTRIQRFATFKHDQAPFPWAPELLRKYAS